MQSCFKTLKCDYARLILVPFLCFNLFSPLLVINGTIIQEYPQASNNYRPSLLKSSYSVEEDLPIASIILNFFFIHDTILTQMVISYLGTGFQNETNEHISVAGIIENVIISRENEPIEYQLDTDSELNQSEIYFSVNELIPKGQYYVLQLEWERTITIGDALNHNISVYWHKEIGISAIKVVLGTGYSYVSATNPPDQVKPETNDLVLRWTEIFQESFSCSIVTIYEEPYFEEDFSITPLEFEIISKEHKLIPFTINVENTGNSTLQVKIYNGLGIRSVNSSVTLVKPLEKLSYRFEGNLTNIDVLQSNVTIQIEYFNGTQLVFHIPVNITVENNPYLLLIGLLLFFGGITILGVGYLYKNRKSVNGILERRRRKLNSGKKTSNTIDNQKLQEIEDILSEDPNSQGNLQEGLKIETILETYRTRLKRKEMVVFEILLKNPFGHSQAELCELTGISKATMSRIVSQLEIQHLVDREKSGMSKIVKIKDKF